MVSTDAGPSQACFGDTISILGAVSVLRMFALHTMTVSDAQNRSGLCRWRCVGSVLPCRTHCRNHIELFNLVGYIVCEADHSAYTRQRPSYDFLPEEKSPALNPEIIPSLGVDGPTPAS